jgi:hypothetical protein
MNAVVAADDGMVVAADDGMVVAADDGMVAERIRPVVDGRTFEEDTKQLACFHCMSCM